MTWMGVVDVATLQKAIIGGNYFPGYIHRDNSYTYNQGSEVYLLDAPDGEVFVMQSYNAHTDQGLAAEEQPCRPRRQAHAATRLEVPGQDPRP